MSQPAEVQQLLSLADKHFHEDRLSEALALYRQALALTPDNDQIHIHIGYIFLQNDNPEEARKSFEKALTLNPDSFDAHYFLGNLFLRKKALGAALAMFRKALQLKPDFPHVMHVIGTLLRDQGCPDEAAVMYRQAIAAEPDNADTWTNALFNLKFGALALSADAVATEHFKFGNYFEERLSSSRIIKHANNRQPDRRLRIGYVSGDFRRHSVALFMLPILEHHDREKFHIYCYYNNTVEDDITEKIAAHADVFLPCAPASDDQLAERIRSDEIDILVDLSGHTDLNRLLTFARKPAPIQVTYLGYIDGTGLRAMDYRLTNADADPPGAERLYRERLYRFENQMWWTYRPPGDLPEPGPPPALGNGYTTFISINQGQKISPLCIRMWSEILRRTPRSRLKIMGVDHAEMQQKLTGDFSRAGIDATRLQFFGRVSMDDYRLHVQSADLALDTTPFNGGTTSCELLCLGLPFVALIGDHFAARVGYALLKDIGLPELAAATPDDYVDIAVRLVSDLPALAALRQRTKSLTMRSSLREEQAFTRSLEAAYREMWRRYLADS